MKKTESTNGLAKRISELAADPEKSLEAAAEQALQELTEPAGRETQAGRLLAIIREAGLELCHDAEDVTYCRVEVNGHLEVYPIDSKATRRFLTMMFNEAEGRPPGRDAIRQAIDALDAEAKFKSEFRSVFLRVGTQNGRVYIDLCDKDWRVIEVTATGFRVLDRSPVWFRRAPAMMALPFPEKPGDVSALLADVKDLLNLATDRDNRLAVAWMLSALLPEDEMQFPVRVDQGPQGSGKSTRSRLIRSVTDPSSIPIRSVPREERDLVIAAKNGRVLAFDNISSLPDWLSDGLCKISTGGGFGTRSLFTNDEEALFSAKRPIQVNGIETIATRPDLISRAILTESEEIDKADRREESEIVADFELLRPRLFGLLLHGIEKVIERKKASTRGPLPRMADFARAVTAAEPAFGWEDGTFLRDFFGAQDDAVREGLEANTVAVAVLHFMTAQQSWTGPASGLLENLNEQATEPTKRTRGWPKAANAMTGQLKRLAPALKEIGILATYNRTESSRTWTISHVATPSEDRGRQERQERQDPNQETHLQDDDADRWGRQDDDADDDHQSGMTTVNEGSSVLKSPIGADSDGNVDPDALRRHRGGAEKSLAHKGRIA